MRWVIGRLSSTSCRARRSSLVGPGFARPQNRGLVDILRICAEECQAKCCRETGDVLLHGEEPATLRQLARERGLSLTLQEGLLGEGVLLPLPCVFLQGNLCGIHEHRPLGCRAYPTRYAAGCRLAGWKPPPRVFIGVPRGGFRDDQWEISFRNLVADARTAGLLAGDPLFVQSCRVDNNRNEIGQRFLRDSHADYLLMVDDDMQFPRGTVQVLASLMKQHQLDILGGLYFQRGSDYHPHVYAYDDVRPDRYGEPAHQFSWEKTTRMVKEAFTGMEIGDEPALVANMPLWEVDATGTGCIIIARRVLERTPYPWFRNEMGTGGDLMFCIKAKRAGFKTHTAAGVVCTHSIAGRVGVKRFLEAQGG